MSQEAFIFIWTHAILSSAHVILTLIFHIFQILMKFYILCVSLSSYQSCWRHHSVSRLSLNLSAPLCPSQLPSATPVASEFCATCALFLQRVHFPSYAGVGEGQSPDCVGIRVRSMSLGIPCKGSS